MFADKVRADKDFKAVVDSGAMRRPNIKISRAGIKKQPKMTVGTIMRMAKLLEGKRPGMLVDVKLNKKLKS